MRNVPLAAEQLRRQDAAARRADTAEKAAEKTGNLLAVLRRSGRAAEKQKLIRVGGLEMNLGEHIVTADGIRIQLTLKEFELLRTFMTNPGRAFTREQLLSSVWCEDFLGETRTVDVHVGTLRQKLGSCGKYIRTVRGVGYRLEV